MRIRVFDFYLTIEYSFVLILSFALLFDVKDVLQLLLFSSLHELGHIAALLIFGGKIDFLTFSFYGLALGFSTQLSKAKEFILLITGPLVNLVLYLFLRDDINLLLFTLNIIPIYPLDGGRLIKLLIPNMSGRISIVFLVAVSVFSIYVIIYYHSFSLLFISVYLIIYSLFY